jgi:hypothetical protein
LHALNVNGRSHLPPQPPCAPVLTGGPVVDGVWRRLAGRAGTRPGLPLTDDPDLHLLVDGRRRDASRPQPGVHRFWLTSAPVEARLVSRAASPQELGLARDPRFLGVAVHRIVLNQGAHQRVVEADDASLVDGFHGHEIEVAGQVGFRWSNGDALLPAWLFRGIGGPFRLDVHLVATGHYIDDRTTHRAA